MNPFKISIASRAVHSGLGFDQGDGMDIEDKVLQFGKNPVWLSLPLYIKIETKANIYEYWWNKNYKWTPKPNQQA